jgi:hypothetical protein
MMKLWAVPMQIARTPRSAAIGAYVFPQTEDFPIGDLYHARLALIYAMAPSHKRQRSAIKAGVKAHWPQYNWAKWWRDHMAAKKKRGSKRGRRRA